MAGVHGQRPCLPPGWPRVFSPAAARHAREGFPSRGFPFSWSLGEQRRAVCVGACATVRQRLGLWGHAYRALGHVSHSAGYATGLIGVHRLKEFAPGTDGAPGDDVVDSCLGELAAGYLGEMPMRHQGLLEFEWPGLEHRSTAAQSRATRSSPSSGSLPVSRAAKVDRPAAAAVASCVSVRPLARRRSAMRWPMVCRFIGPRILDHYPDKSSILDYNAPVAAPAATRRANVCLHSRQDERVLNTVGVALFGLLTDQRDINSKPPDSHFWIWHSKEIKSGPVMP